MKKPMSILVRTALSKALEPLIGESARLLMYREFREGLSLSKEEGELVGLKTIVQGNEFSTYVQFPDKDPMKEIEVGEVITEVVCQILKPLEETKTLPPDQLDLFLWFKPEIVKMQEREKKEQTPKNPEPSR